MTSKEKAVELLKLADVEINGNDPWDIQVHDERFYGRLFSKGTLGVGEAYMDGWWDSDALDELTSKVLSAHLEEKIKALPLLVDIAKAKFFNLQAGKRAYNIGEAHYDKGNDLYEAMLGESMTYTCGYWKNAKNLEEAQYAKYDLICQKVGLKNGDRILDIGGGWASFGIFAAKNYGAETVAITVSKEQAKLGAERAKGLPVEVRVQDYRDVSDGPYDHIVSIGMFEHVGHKNYRTYMKKVHELLKDDGLFLLHTIGGRKSSTTAEPWINKYIFPDGMLPSIAQIGKSIEELFTMEDWHNFGADYHKTLMAWYENFDREWPKLKGEKYDDRFYRMWKFYLLTMAGSFKSRTHNQLWHIVLSKNGVEGGYQSVR